MESFISVKRTIRILLLLVSPLFILQPASAVISYVNICGLVSYQGVAMPGIRVEARRCSDNSLVVSLASDTNPTNNYHLVYESLDDGQPGGQFAGHYSPIPVYVTFSTGCTNILVPCAEIATGYASSSDGKLGGLNQTLNCLDNLSLISIAQTGVDIVISFNSVSGVSYQLEQTAKLDLPASWIPVPTLSQFSGTGGRIDIVQRIDPTATQLFYRLVTISP